MEKPNTTFDKTKNDDRSLFSPLLDNTKFQVLLD